MRIWIDAAEPDCERQVFHMTLLERHLRGIAMVESRLRGLEQVEKKKTGLGPFCSAAEAAMRPTEVAISLPDGASPPAPIPDGPASSLPVRWISDSV